MLSTTTRRARENSRSRYANFLQDHPGSSKCEPCKLWDRLSPPPLSPRLATSPALLTTPARSLLWLGPWRTQQRRHESPTWHHQGRQFTCPHSALRGGLELPDHTEGRAVDE